MYERRMKAYIQAQFSKGTGVASPCTLAEVRAGTDYNDNMKRFQSLQ